VGCSGLQWVAATHHSVLVHPFRWSLRVLQCVAVCCSVLQCVAVVCSGLQRVAAGCSVLQQHHSALIHQFSSGMCVCSRVCICMWVSVHMCVYLYWWWSLCMSHVSHMNESCHTYEWVMSHIWMSHVSHSIPHIWMRHASHMNESRHTHTWMSRVYRSNASCFSCKRIKSQSS